MPTALRRAPSFHRDRTSSRRKTPRPRRSCSAAPAFSAKARSMTNGRAVPATLRPTTGACFAWHAPRGSFLPRPRAYRAKSAAEGDTSPRPTRRVVSNPIRGLRLWGEPRKSCAVRARAVREAINTRAHRVPVDGFSTQPRARAARRVCLVSTSPNRAKPRVWRAFPGATCHMPAIQRTASLAPSVATCQIRTPARRAARRAPRGNTKVRPDNHRASIAYRDTSTP